MALPEEFALEIIKVSKKGCHLCAQTEELLPNIMKVSFQIYGGEQRLANERKGLLFQRFSLWSEPL